MARVLVVDDEGDIRALTRRVLTREGYDVDLARDGSEALKWLNDYDYDLVILDVMMPNLNGLEVVRNMKNTERLEGVPVLLFSALGSGVKLMLEEGNKADDFIEKPFTKKDLMKKVEKLVK